MVGVIARTVTMNKLAVYLGIEKLKAIKKPLWHLE